MKIWLAVALRIFAGASCIDVALLFGIAKESVFHIMWQVVDAIDNTRSGRSFFLRQGRSAPGKRRSGRWVHVCS